MDQTPREATPETVTSPEEERPVAENRASASRAGVAALVGIAAWIVPGLGHLLIGRWGRALIFFGAVAGLAVLGYEMRGDVFPPHSLDPFGTLGFLADAGSGSFYFLARVFEPAGGDISTAMGDYGTRVIASAGVVNILAVIDAYETAWRRRG